MFQRCEYFLIYNHCTQTFTRTPIRKTSANVHCEFVSHFLNKLLNVFSRITYVSPNSPMNINKALSRRGAMLGVAASDAYKYLSVPTCLYTIPSTRAKI